MGRRARDGGAASGAAVGARGEGPPGAPREPNLRAGIPAALLVVAVLVLQVVLRMVLLLLLVSALGMGASYHGRAG